MGSFNPNNQLNGFPNNYVVNSNTQELSKLITVGGTGFGSISNLITTAYRYGDRLIGRVTFTSGTTVASLGWIQLPAGLTIAPFASPALIPSRRCGIWMVVATITGNIAVAGSMGAVFCDGTNLDRLLIAYRTSANVYLNDTASAMISSGNSVDIDFDIPIAQWAV